jgi:hypothetical protein
LKWILRPFFFFKSYVFEETGFWDFYHGTNEGAGSPKGKFQYLVTQVQMPMQEFFLFDKWVYYTQVFVPLLGVFPLFIYLFIYLLYQFCGRWSGHHPQEDLAKFGYMSVRKVEKFRNPAIFL